MALSQPINFNEIRRVLVREIMRMSGKQCILNMPTTQSAPRPPLPYFSVDIRSSALFYGRDAQGYVSETTFFSGGVRGIMINIEAYAQEREDAYGLMSLIQGGLSLEGVLGRLRTAGIAVSSIGNVVDLTELLNTGYEGRAQLDVKLFVASNMEEDLGEIETVEITEEVEADGVEIEQSFTVPE